MMDNVLESGVVMRKLEIGPGYDGKRLEGFETLDIQKRDNVDHVADASGKLPFDDNSFNLVYAAHVLEHFYWRQVEDALKEWCRIIKPGGALEIWVPDGLMVAEHWLMAEKGNAKLIKKYNLKTYRRSMVKQDPCLWANAKINSIGGIHHPPFGDHKVFFSRRYLNKALVQAGFLKVKKLTRKQIRGKDYGHYQIGVIAKKGE